MSVVGIFEIVQYVRSLSNKDAKGNALSPSQINTSLRFVSLHRFEGLWKTACEIAKTEKRPLAEVIFSVGDLSSFVNTVMLVPTTNKLGGEDPAYNITIQTAPYPADYRFTLGLTAHDVPVTPKPYTQIARYRGGLLNGKPDKEPLAFEGSGKFEFIPNDLTDLVLTYLRVPATPYYDFCLSDDDLEIFMPVGSYIRYNEPMGYFNLFDKDGVVIEVNVHRDELEDLSDIYASLTVDVDWKDTVHQELADGVLEHVGVNLRAKEVTEYAITKEK